MTRPIHHKLEMKEFRRRYLKVFELADAAHAAERELIELLHKIEGERIHLVFGFRSLRKFCHKALGFTLAQSQRITTEVRRFELMVHSGAQDASHGILMESKPAATAPSLEYFFEKSASEKELAVGNIIARHPGVSSEEHARLNLKTWRDV